MKNIEIDNRIKKIFLFAAAILFAVVFITIVEAIPTQASDSWIVYTNYNGVDGWWYTSDGVVDENYTGVAQNEYGWWYCENGQVRFDYTGIAPNEYGWWRIVNGQVDFNCNSVECNEYGWWYCRGGKVQFDYTGIAPNEYGWWRIVNGRVDFNCNSVECNEYGWWYCRGGKVQFDYTGIAPNEYGWWRIVGGQVDFNCNSVESNEYGWWAIQGGKVNFDFTGVEGNAYGNWYCINGEVRFDYNGIVNYYGVTYNVRYGQAYTGPLIAICSTYGSGYQADGPIINSLQNIGCTVIRVNSYEDISCYDGLVISGGIDIDPAFYGETNYACESYSTAYDNEQFAIIRKFVNAEKPILGICRGCQLLNVYFGGSLNQNVSGHRGSNKEPIWHAVSAKNGSILASVCGTSFSAVSHHHQTLKKIASCFNATMYAPDGTVECIEHYWYPIIGIMWHPEYMNNDTGYAFLRYFAYTMCE